MFAGGHRAGCVAPTSTPLLELLGGTGTPRTEAQRCRIDQAALAHWTTPALHGTRFGRTDALCISNARKRSPICTIDGACHQSGLRARLRQRRAHGSCCPASRPSLLCGRARLVLATWRPVARGRSCAWRSSSSRSSRRVSLLLDTRNRAAPVCRGQRAAGCGGRRGGRRADRGCRAARRHARIRPVDSRHRCRKGLKTAVGQRAGQVGRGADG